MALLYHNNGYMSRKIQKVNLKRHSSPGEKTYYCFDFNLTSAKNLIPVYEMLECFFVTFETFACYRFFGNIG